MFRFGFVIFLLFFFFPFPLWSQATLKKSVRVGEKFSITIYTENQDEYFEIARMDSTLINNTFIYRENDKCIFEFLPLTSGQLTLSIRKVIGTNIIDNYLIYHITTMPIKNSRIKITQTKGPKKSSTKSKKLRNSKNNEENLQLEVIRKLYDTSLYSESLKQIIDFKKQFPKSKYHYAITHLHSKILEKKNELDQAKEMLENFLKKNKNIKANKKVEIYKRLAELSEKKGENEAAITLLLTAVSLPQFSVSNTEYLNYKLASIYLQEKKYLPAFTYYQKIYSNHSKKKHLYDLNLYDDTLMQMANILENSSKLRDVKKAYQLYEELIETYPQSRWIKQAQIKKKHLLRHFIDPK